MNKMVVNHLEKLFVTSDTATIVSELEVQHPAARMVVLAAQAQQQEVGDGTNLVISLAGELLGNAAGLITEGLQPLEVADGYKKAADRALALMDELVLAGSDTFDTRDEAEIARRIRASVGTKQSGFEDVLCPLVARACVSVLPKNAKNFNVDNVRVCKMVGGGLYDSEVVKGLVVPRPTEGAVRSAEKVKVAVFPQGVEASATETKGTVLIKNAEELLAYSKTEEAAMEKTIRGIADAGVGLVVSGSAVSELAMHFLEKFDIMVLRLNSKFDLRRLCRATGAVALVKLQVPTQEELGFAKEVRVEEIGGTTCTVLRQDEAMGSVATVVLRGATQQILDDAERAVDDGVNAYRMLTKDPRTVPAGGAVEMEIATALLKDAQATQGLDQYAIQKFAEALEVVPRVLAENSGFNATECVGKLYSAHAAGDKLAGLDLLTGEPKDLARDDIVDMYLSKWWAVKLASDAVNTVLKVDQIIMAKQAGGPKPKAPGAMDD